MLQPEGKARLQKLTAPPRAPNPSPSRNPTPNPSPDPDPNPNPNPNPDPDQAAVGAVGVWGRAVAADGGPGDPDDLATLQQLVDAGVTFINSVLPRSFLEGRGTPPSA